MAVVSLPVHVGKLEEILPERKDNLLINRTSILVILNRMNEHLT